MQLSILLLPLPYIQIFSPSPQYSQHIYIQFTIWKVNLIVTYFEWYISSDTPLMIPFLIIEKLLTTMLIHVLSSNKGVTWNIFTLYIQERRQSVFPTQYNLTVMPYSISTYTDVF